LSMTMLMSVSGARLSKRNPEYRIEANHAISENYSPI
jgi:hypothetical protein